MGVQQCVTPADMQLFDRDGQSLRAIGQGLLSRPSGVCVDSRGRVYVASNTTHSVVVLDGAGAGTLLADIAVPGRPLGVLVTRAGQIVVTLEGGPSAALVVLS